MKIRFLFLILIIFSTINGEDRIESIRKKVKEIDIGINESEKNITISKKEEQKILKQLSQIEKDLRKITGEYSEASEEYKILSRNVDYAEKNLSIIDEELLLRKQAYLDILFKSEKKNYKDVSSEYNISNELQKEEIKKILNQTKNKMGDINYVKTQVKEVQEKIADEKSQLAKLRRDLANKKSQINAKKREHALLVRKLKNKQSYYNSQIKKLKEQRTKSQKEIERIISERVKMAGDYNVKVILEELGYMEYPLKGKVTLYYGQEKLNDIRSQGMEISGRLGSIIRVANRGTIVFSEKFEGMGTMIIVNHGYNLVSVYGNLIKSYVKEGDTVDKGDNIGILGLSSAREAVLYFETRLAAKDVDPKTFLKD